MVTTITYFLPLVGTVANLKTFSGDPNDPIRPLGIREFAQNNEQLKEMMQAMRVQNYNIDKGTVEVEVEAEEQFHLEFAKWLEGKKPQDICAIYGKEQLVFPLEGVKPDEQLLKIGHL